MRSHKVMEIASLGLWCSSVKEQKFKRAWRAVEKVTQEITDPSDKQCVSSCCILAILVLKPTRSHTWKKCTHPVEFPGKITGLA